MNAGTKSTIKLLGCLALLGMVYILSIAFWLKQFAPAPGVTDYLGLKHQGVPLTEARRVTHPAGHVCLFGDIDSVMWTLPSGPPAYLFDSSGALVDYTHDVGDSTKFQNVYQVHHGPIVPISEIEREFGIDP